MREDSSHSATSSAERSYRHNGMQVPKFLLSQHACSLRFASSSDLHGVVYGGPLVHCALVVAGVVWPVNGNAFTVFFGQFSVPLSLKLPPEFDLDFGGGLRVECVLFALFDRDSLHSAGQPVATRVEISQKACAFVCSLIYSLKSVQMMIFKRKLCALKKHSKTSFLEANELRLKTAMKNSQVFS